MREVAAAAGVSLKTVSRVVNEERGVSPEVRARVLEAVRHLGYRPNLAASNLRRTTARTGLVAVLLDDLGAAPSARLLRALEDGVRPHGLALLTASLDGGPTDERERFRDVLAHRVDGVVVSPRTVHLPHVRDVARAGTPVVLVGRSPRGLAVDSVSPDVRGGARTAADHLLDQGHRRIAAILPGWRSASAHPASAGHEAALTGRGLEPDRSLLVTDLASEEAAAQTLLDMLDRPDPPTAVVTGDVATTTAALRVAASRGLGHSLALVALEDVPLAEVLDPPLTTVRHDATRLGATVADLLLNRIAGDDSPHRHVVIAPTLVPRGSGEIAPALADRSARVRRAGAGPGA
jgi:LacI family transcriptional regulator